MTHLLDAHAPVQQRHEVGHLVGDLVQHRGRRDGPADGSAAAQERCPDGNAVRKVVHLRVTGTKDGVAFDDRRPKPLGRDASSAPRESTTSKPPNQAHVYHTADPSARFARRNGCFTHPAVNGAAICSLVTYDTTHTLSEREIYLRPSLNHVKRGYIFRRSTAGVGWEESQFQRWNQERTSQEKM